MCFKRSTRKIVTSGRHKESNGTQDNVGSQVPEGCIDPEAISESEQKPVQKPALVHASKKTFVLPVLLLTLVALIVGIAISRKSGHAASAPVISQGQVVVAVSADAALCGQAVPGDVVRLYCTDGQPIPELQYVQVYGADTDEELLLLVDDLQAAALVSQERNPKVTLVVHGDDTRAAELIDLQARINDPEIQLVLQQFANVAPGTDTQLTFETVISPKEAALPPVEWSSSDPEVASVQDGIVTAHKVGTVEITAACGETIASCEVIVEVKLTEIKLDPTQAVLAIDETMYLSALPVPEDVAEFDVTWSVGDHTIADMVMDGEIIGIAPGTTKVVATCGDIQAECEITVGYHAELVQLDKQALQLSVGEEDYISAVVYPKTDVIDSQIFESSNPEIVTVDEQGKVTGVAPGTATITFRCGEQSAQCEVVVTPAV